MVPFDTFDTILEQKIVNEIGFSAFSQLQWLKN